MLRFNTTVSYRRLGPETTSTYESPPTRNLRRVGDALHCIQQTQKTTTEYILVRLNGNDDDPLRGRGNSARQRSGKWRVVRVDTGGEEKRREERIACVYQSSYEIEPQNQ